MTKNKTTKLFWALVATCVVLFIADAFYSKHGAFSIENLVVFFAIFGFIACAALVLVARWARTLLERPEDYYDADE